MIPVPDKVRQYLHQNHRKLYTRVVCNDSEVIGAIREKRGSKGSCGRSSFQPQTVFSNSVNISIDKCANSLKGKKVSIQYGVPIDGEILWFTTDTVYVNNAPVKGERTIIEGLGVISAKLGRKFTGGTFSTMSSLLSHISAVAGCSIALDDGLEDIAINEADLSEYLYREVLGMAAGCYFCYATEAADGSIVIKKFSTVDGTVQASLSRMANEPDFYEEATVEGIQVIASDNKELIVGSLQNCSLSNPLMTEEAFNKYKDNYVGFSYEACDMELTLGDFTLEPWDVVQITDRKGRTHNVRCMSLTLTFDGGLKTTISCPTLESGEDFSRGETSMQANTAYNALISGNFGSGGSGEGGAGISSIERFSVGGTHINNGIGWIDSGGCQAFFSFNVSLPAVSSTTTLSGQMVCDTTRSLASRGTSFSHTYVTIPIFAHNGEMYYGAGGLAIAFSIGNSIGTNTFDYTCQFKYTNEYLRIEELGELYTYNSETGLYEILASANFQINTSWLLNTVAT